MVDPADDLSMVIKYFLKHLLHVETHFICLTCILSFHNRQQITVFSTCKTTSNYLPGGSKHGESVPTPYQAFASHYPHIKDVMHSLEETKSCETLGAQDTPGRRH
jgi:hypothetical protein